MVEQVVRNWGWMALRGAMGILFGALTLLNPGITLVTLVLLFGAYAIVDGVFMIVSAIANRKYQPRWGTLLFGGILGVAVGVTTYLWPAITALTLLAIIATWAVTMGIVEITIAVKLRKLISGEWLMVLAGLLAVAFGVLLLLNPGPGALTVVLWIGAYATTSGVLLLVLAFRLRNWGRSHGVLPVAA